MKQVESEKREDKKKEEEENDERLATSDKIECEIVS